MASAGCADPVGPPRGPPKAPACTGLRRLRRRAARGVTLARAATPRPRPAEAETQQAVMPTPNVLGFACARCPSDRRRRSAPAAMGGAHSAGAHLMLMGL